MMQPQPYEKQSITYAIIAGIASGVAFALSVKGGFFSILIAYLPYLPLMIGLSIGAPYTSMASLIALLVAGVSTGLSGLVGFAVLYAIPTTFFVKSALNKRLLNTYPIGGVLTGLSIYSASIVFFLAMALFGDEGTLNLIMPELQGDDSVMMQKMVEIIDKMPFVILAGAAWLQLSIFYGCAVLANYLLAGWNHVERPSLRIKPFMPLALVLIILLITGLFSFSSDSSIQIAGKSAFITLLYPYFLMGIAQMHHYIARWKNTRLWLTGIYGFTILAFWPVFWFILAGLYLQAKFLSNRYASGNGTDKGSDN